MGRKSINYTTREIIFYRFVCNDTEIINTYVGSTTDLVKRRCGHRRSCNNSTDKGYNYKVYEVIRKNGGWDAWKMIEIERRIVKDNQDAVRIEQQWIEFYHAQMNTKKAHTTAEQVKEYQKQYNLEHAEEKKENRKQYNLEHTEQIKERQKQYNLEHAEQIKEKNKQYNLEHAEQIKEHKKQYRLENAERIKEHKKQYYLKNAERIKEQQKQYQLKKKAELNTTI